MTLDFVAVQSFAGGFDMGATQAGLRMMHKVEQKGGFGIRNCTANRHLLGDQWDWQACAPAEWEPFDVPVLLGNPPCSGFSALSRSDFRGVDSVVNECMWAYADYIIKVRPLVAVMESVQQAYRQGVELMRALRAKVEWETGERYDLYHVLHNNASVGGCSIRKRYFWVITRVPFGIERQVTWRVPVLDDVIGDLAGLGNTWESQPYVRPSSWYAEARGYRREDGLVDGHYYRTTPYLRRALDLIEGSNGVGPWGTKEIISTVARRYHEQQGRLPESWNASAEKVIAKDFFMGYNQLIRWDGQKMARVLTGGALGLVMHPQEDRTLTQREVARVMGFPDEWRIKPLKGAPGLDLTWGKGISTPCGKWIGHWVTESIEGRPGSYTGDPGEQDREWIIDVTNDYRLHGATAER